MPATDLRVDQAALKSLQQTLRKLEPETQKNLKRELKEVAQIVATGAKSKVPSRTGRAAGSIRAGSTLKGSYVQGGKASVPYYGWLDFGGRTPTVGFIRGGRGPWTKSGIVGKHGRFIYVALDENRDEITKHVRTAVNKAIDQLF
jgi:hypothetical protein